MAIELTEADQIRMNLLAALNYDTAATERAVAFVQDDPLKYQLFTAQLNRVNTEAEYVAKTIKAVKLAEESLPLFAASDAVASAAKK
ncbi:DUF2560 family protein [Escherichia coli O8:H10]